MPETHDARRWLGRAAVAAWLVVGTGAVLLAPEPEAPSPTEAELLYHTAPSSRSSAPAGTLAFARLLGSIGFDVGEHSGIGSPDADVLLVLEPRYCPSVEEASVLIDWVRRGGRLVYAPGDYGGSRVSWRDGDRDRDELAGDERQTEDGDETSFDRSRSETAGNTVDTLAVAVDSESADGARVEGPASLWRVGAGRVALLDSGAAVLSNEALDESGIRDQLGWLRWMLAGVRTVAFDEGRLGFGEAPGLWSLVTRSRFSTGIELALLALAILLVARGARRLPALPEPTPGGRAFGEHIDAVADVMRVGARTRLAGSALVEGTRRRLGVLAATPRAAEEIERAEKALAGSPSPGAVVRLAARLRDLETTMGLVADAADAARMKRI